MLKLYVNGSLVPLEMSKFPGGEVNVRIQETSDQGIKDSHQNSIHIHARLHSSEAILKLLLLTDAVRRKFGPEHPIHLVCPYLPYARQDRVCNPGESLSLRVICDLINSQNYSSVEIWDAHSDVATALLNRVVHRTAAEFLMKLPLKNAICVAPDAGAIKRTTACAKALGLPMVRADKRRELTTGAITETLVYSDHVGDADFIMIDDICDGGRTFIELAKKLRPLTRGKIQLYVTHGIFSNGFEVFQGVIDQIYVANSFVELLPDFVTPISLKGVPYDEN
jgi:ribose-phosphate pyrophosphokinase